MKLLKLFSLVAMVFLLTQCYPEGPVYTDEVDIVYSNYDSEYNFNAKQTFAMPDKIVKVDGSLVQGETPTFVNAIYAGPMLEQIRKNMIAAGWAEVEVSANPDVLVAPAAIEYTTYYYDYWYYWDWWYGGYYPPGGGWYYPYPVSSFSTGTLVVNVVDPNELSPTDRPKVAWIFAINGLLQGSTTEFNSRMTKGIDQAFIQSPYVKK